MTTKLIRFFENKTVRSAITRASRTFLQTFLAVITGAPLVNLNVSSVKAAAVAGLGAVFSLLQRSLDAAGVSPIPPG